MYQLTFTWLASNYESKAKAHALETVVESDFNGNQNDYNNALKQAERAFLTDEENKSEGIFSYKSAAAKRLNLGLDLQGGMSVVLQVMLEDAIEALTNKKKDTNFVNALKGAKEAQKNSQDDFVSLFRTEFEKLVPGNNGMAPYFATQMAKNKINYNSSNDEVEAYIREEAKTAVKTTFEILKTRIDKFGVSQPNVQLIESQGRIIVELPGVDDADRVRNLLQATANLEFWEMREMDGDLAKVLTQADARLADRLKLNKNKSEATPNTTEINDSTGLNTPTPVSNEEKSPLLSKLQLFGQAGNPILGIISVNDTAEVNGYLRDESLKVLPKRLKLLYSAKPEYKSDENLVKNDMLAVYAIEGRIGRDFKPPLDGTVVTDARQNFDPMTNEVVVSMDMNAEGAQKWAKMTGANVGQFVGVVLDDLVYSAPRVNGEIKGGSTQISGDFTVVEAQDLANILKAGKLPAPARIVEATTVGPTLGQASITAGLISLLAGILLVLVFMVLYYGGGGVVSVIALLLNLFFIIGVLASLGATLTLPGMAGIVLTIGMAVDANVIIYERIREEIDRVLEDGEEMTLRRAIIEGFSKSYSAILDANVTTLITAIILAIYGLGPVLGFAVILIIGILSSLFTAVLIARIIIDGRTEGGKEMTFWSGFSKGAFKNLNIDFVSKRKYSYIASGVFILIGFISFFVNQFQYGVDFSGGRTYVVKFDNNVATNEIANALNSIYGSEPQVTTYGTADQVKITTSYEINSNDEKMDSKVAQMLFDGVKGFYATAPASYDAFAKTNILSSQKVGPTIADDITKNSMIAGGLALICILLYLTLRFRKWQYGVAAVVTVVHDSLILLTVFSLFQFLPWNMEINQSFIAAILTVIGYSINDTVVVFDRIREYLAERDVPFLQNVNDAINSTLSRTIITSLTTLIVVLILFVFGGEAIRGFSFALLIGIFVGTYSSIFIATPLVVDFYTEDKPKKTPPTIDDTEALLV